MPLNQGGAIALRVFHTHVLPHLAQEGLGLPRQLVPAVEKLQAGMTNAALGISPTTTPLPAEEVASSGATEKDDLLLKSKPPIIPRIPEVEEMGDSAGHRRVAAAAQSL